MTVNLFCEFLWPQIHKGFEYHLPGDRTANVAMAALLAQEGADLHKKNSRGLTPLELCTDNVASLITSIASSRYPHIKCTPYSIFFMSTCPSLCLIISILSIIYRFVCIFLSISLYLSYVSVSIGLSISGVYLHSYANCKVPLNL